MEAHPMPNKRELTVEAVEKFLRQKGYSSRENDDGWYRWISKQIVAHFRPESRDTQRSSSGQTNWFEVATHICGMDDGLPHSLTREDILGICWGFLNTVTIVGEGKPNIPNQQVIFKEDIEGLADAIMKGIV